MELIQADFHQTFRICLRYTKVILKDPRRYLRISQPPPKPLKVTSRELVCLLGRCPRVGERCHAWRKQTAAFNVSPRWKITRQMELFLTWAAHAASSRDGILASNFFFEQHQWSPNTHTHTLFKKKKPGIYYIFSFFQYFIFKILHNIIKYSL